MADTLIFVATCADENPDKATIPFALGNSALAMDTDVIIVLQATGVFLGKKDYARHIHAPGFPRKTLYLRALHSGKAVDRRGPAGRD